jgi:mannose-6-phosphate isomerase-like protein (cupin superfamily)
MLDRAPAMTHIPAGQGRSVRVITDLATFKLVGEETAGAFWLAEVAMDPGAGGPPMLTAHPSQEVWYILEGEFEFEGLVGERPYTHRAGPGSVVHAPGGAAHRVRNVGATPGRFLSIHAPAGMERFFQELGTPVAEATAPPAPAGPPDRDRLLALAREHGIEFVVPSAGRVA